MTYICFVLLLLLQVDVQRERDGRCLMFHIIFVDEQRDFLNGFVTSLHYTRLTRVEPS
jgi:hypothetical protein